MKQEYLRTMYTEEDERGFHFTDVSEAEKKQQIAELKIKRNKCILLLALLLIPVIPLNYVLETEIGKYWVACYAMLCAFVVGVYIYSYFLRIRRIRREREQYFNVEILEKLPEEQEWSLDVEGGHYIYFYPVMGRDVTTGYESRCYITYEKYTNAKPHDVIRIQRFVKIKR